MKLLHLLTWPDYVDPQTLAQFRSATGVAVEPEIVPSAVELISRMQQPRAGVDVLCPPDYAVRELAARGKLLTLNASWLPNLKNLESRFLRGRPHDPESRLSVIKDWGTTGYIYRTDLLAGTPGSWADFWSLAVEYSGKVTVLDSPGEVIGAALKMRGHSYNAADPRSLAKCEADLLSLKPHLLAFETDYKPLLASGRACLSLGWSGDAASLAAGAVPVRYVVPSEGSQIWEDDWAIAAETQSAQAAHAFLDFVLQPEIAAQEARYTRYATGNRAALSLLESSLRQDQATYPPDDILQKLESGFPMDNEGQARREQLWRRCADDRIIATRLVHWISSNEFNASRKQLLARDRRYARNGCGPVRAGKSGCSRYRRRHHRSQRGAGACEARPESRRPRSGNHRLGCQFA